MKPSELESIAMEAEDAYRFGVIQAMEFRRRMYLLGSTPEACDERLDVLDIDRAEMRRAST